MDPTHPMSGSYDLFLEKVAAACRIGARLQDAKRLGDVGLPLVAVAEKMLAEEVESACAVAAGLEGDEFIAAIDLVMGPPGPRTRSDAT